MHDVRRTQLSGAERNPGANRLELKKYCRRERKHTPHKESRKKVTVGPSAETSVCRERSLTRSVHERGRALVASSLDLAVR